MVQELNFRDIGVRIQTYRLERNMTQEQLAEQIDSTQKYLSYIESGRSRLRLDTAAAIAKALDISIDALLADRTDSSDPSNLQLLLSDIRGMSPRQLDMLREQISFIKKYEK